MTPLSTSLTTLAAIVLALKFPSAAVVVSAVWVTTLVGRTIHKIYRGIRSWRLPAT
ncbi:MAG: hypothetical protein HOK42_12325 [Candidatus Marinimicrobia bacterium]|nr:hypothetical protein [Candidatus Neomarinimicrobiota bacterium]